MALTPFVVDGKSVQIDSAAFVVCRILAEQIARNFEVALHIFIDRDCATIVACVVATEDRVDDARHASYCALRQVTGCRGRSVVRALLVLPGKGTEHATPAAFHLGVVQLVLHFRRQIGRAHV